MLPSLWRSVEAALGDQCSGRRQGDGDTVHTRQHDVESGANVLVVNESWPWATWRRLQIQRPCHSKEPLIIEKRGLVKSHPLGQGKQQKN